MFIFDKINYFKSEQFQIKFFIYLNKRVEEFLSRIQIHDVLVFRSTINPI